ncbi:hypothetical protein KKB55_00960, partial [Myxococcota bacterium]|nr:hypothetical protein [Myxococcota bacterium]
PDAAGPDAAAPDAATPDATAPVIYAPLPIDPPEGFALSESGTGWWMYRKDYAGGAPDWVAVVDLRVAQIHSIMEEIIPPPQAHMTQRPPMLHWDQAVESAQAQRHRARLLFSGAFFSPGDDPSPIAFGLSAEGEARSFGYDHDYPDHTNVVAWDNIAGRALIEPYNLNIFESYPDVVGGLTLDSPRDNANQYSPRVMVGVRDFDEDGESEAVIFLASRLQNQPDGLEVLTAFGATETTMWTGGRPAFFFIDGEQRVTGVFRSVHAVAVYEPLDYGCTTPCPQHMVCDPARAECVCDSGFSGVECTTCDGCDPAEVIVDDGEPEFYLFCDDSAALWTLSDDEIVQTGAHGATLRYQLNSATQACMARWQTPMRLEGAYQIEVHIPAPVGFSPPEGFDAWTPCDSMGYTVWHDDALSGEIALIDPRITGWQTLKPSARFSGQRGRVYADHKLSQGECMLPFDAVRWTRTGP